MAEASNPIKGLIEMYEDQVKENDENGFSGAFKESAEAFFTVCECADYHISDVKYLDGYFIFGMGTNSVVHFHVDECPGWLFGIWWDVSDKDNPREIHGSFFTQYEETINKFKPSYSEFSCDICVNLNGYTALQTRRAEEIIKYIKENPHVAFCKDYFCETFDAEEANRRFDEYVEHRDLERAYTAEMDEKILSFVREHIIPMFKGSEIVDLGECWSPRYDLIAPYEENKDLVEDGPGYYGWFSDDDKDNPLRLQFQSLEGEAQKYADEHGFFYFSPIHEGISIYKSKSL